MVKPIQSATADDELFIGPPLRSLTDPALTCGKGQLDVSHQDWRSRPAAVNCRAMLDGCSYIISLQAEARSVRILERTADSSLTARLYWSTDFSRVKSATAELLLAPLLSA